jgi:hypothetical protein
MTYLPRPEPHCDPSRLKRKKFGEGLTHVVSSAPEIPLITVLSGTVLE